MRSVIDDESLAATRPLDISAYLRSNGWVEIDQSHPMALWQKASDDGRTDELLAPQHQSWRDYPQRVAEVLEIVSQAEDRSPLSILRDIVEVTSDVIRLRATTGGPPDGSIKLIDGVKLSECAERMMLAAACAAVEPRRAYHSRKPKKATEYIDGLRMGQTERGSYIVSVLSRVSPILLPAQTSIKFPGMPELQPRAEEPYERKVTRTLAISLDEINKAAARSMATGGLDAFETAVSCGVSADLCEALGVIGDSGNVNGFGVRIGWSSVRPGPSDVPSGTSFSMDSLEVIKEAGRILREKSPFEDFDLEGVVVSLNVSPDRPGTELDGVAIIRGYVEGNVRNVAVRVSGDNWRIADEAMEKRSIVRCVGELLRDSKPFIMNNVRGLRQVDNVE